MTKYLPRVPAAETMGLTAGRSESQLLPSYEIVVNGKVCAVRTDQVDHNQLVRLAFPDAVDNGGSTRSMTVSFRGGPRSAPDGILAPTERTFLANGETFIVVRTDKS